MVRRRCWNSCWPAFSRGFHFNRQSEICASDLVLECKPHKLSFALVERFRKPSIPLWTDRSTALLNVTKVRPGYSKKLCKLRNSQLITGSLRRTYLSARLTDAYLALPGCGLGISWSAFPKWHANKARTIVKPHPATLSLQVRLESAPIGRIELLLRGRPGGRPRQVSIRTAE
jgi:hypothetical protein